MLIIFDRTTSNAYTLLQHWFSFLDFKGIFSLEFYIQNSCFFCRISRRVASFSGRRQIENLFPLETMGLCYRGFIQTFRQNCSCYDRWSLMEQQTHVTPKNDLDVFSRIIHLWILVPGIAAWLTGELAGDFEKTRHLGFTVHKWLGISLSAFVCLRLVYGLIGPRTYRFKQWLPYTKDRLKASWEAALGLLSF